MPLPSQRKAAANRANAQLSTGPKTKQGKDVASQNAYKYGIRADELLSDEDKEEFAAFAGDLTAELQPVGMMENLLVEAIVSHAWRMRRVRRLECSRHETNASGSRRVDLWLPDNGRGLTPQDPSKPTLTCFHPNKGAQDFMHLTRYEGARERGLHRALASLMRLQAARKKIHEK